MKEKTNQSSRRKYDATFKKEVLQMVESGRPVADIAKSLGIGRREPDLSLEKQAQEQVC